MGFRAYGALPHFSLSLKKWRVKTVETRQTVENMQIDPRAYENASLATFLTWARGMIKTMAIMATDHRVTSMPNNYLNKLCPEVVMNVRKLRANEN